MRNRFEILIALATCLGGVSLANDSWVAPSWLALQAADSPQVIVTNTFDSGLGSLREAIAQAPQDAIIRFSSSLSGQTIYFASPITVDEDKNVRIDGSDLLGRITLSGDANRNGRADSGDSRLFDLQASLIFNRSIRFVFDSVSFQKAYASDHGGAFHLSDGGTHVFFINCDFSGNRSAQSGGAVAILNASSASFFDTVMTDNHAEISGGAIAMLGMSCGTYAENSDFSENTAQQYGGAIAASQGTLTVAGCRVVANTSARSGGGISSAGSLFTITETEVLRNIASEGDGGGIYNNQGTMSSTHKMDASNLYVMGNEAPYGRGGGIFHGAGGLKLRHALITDNLADQGGGFCRTSDFSPNVEDTTFWRNSARNGGGLACLGNGKIYLFSCTLYENNATASGGGIFVEAPNASLKYGNSICAMNTATEGVDIFGEGATAISNYRNIISEDPLLTPWLDPVHPWSSGMMPLPGSPAIDQGTERLYRLFDQRSFPRMVGSAPDLGAIEWTPIADPVLLWESDLDGDSIPFGLEYALGTDPFEAADALSEHTRYFLLDNTGTLQIQMLLSPPREQGPSFRIEILHNNNLSSGPFEQVEKTGYRSGGGTVWFNDPGALADGQIYYQIVSELYLSEE